MVVERVPLPAPLSIVHSPDREVGVLPTTEVVMTKVVGAIRLVPITGTLTTYVFGFEEWLKT